MKKINLNNELSFSRVLALGISLGSLSVLMCVITFLLLIMLGVGIIIVGVSCSIWPTPLYILTAIAFASNLSFSGFPNPVNVGLNSGLLFTTIMTILTPLFMMDPKSSTMIMMLVAVVVLAAALLVSYKLLNFTNLGMRAFIVLGLVSALILALATTPGLTCWES